MAKLTHPIATLIAIVFIMLSGVGIEAMSRPQNEALMRSVTAIERPEIRLEDGFGIVSVGNDTLPVPQDVGVEITCRSFFNHESPPTEPFLLMSCWPVEGAPATQAVGTVTIGAITREIPPGATVRVQCPSVERMRIDYPRETTSLQTNCQAHSIGADSIKGPSTFESPTRLFRDANARSAL
jgi:hypothetical protein